MPEDKSTQDKADDDNSKPSGKNRKRIWLLAGLACFFVLVGVAYGAWWLLVGSYYVQTSDAYVHGNRIMLTPQIPGTVVTIHAEDTDWVERGQPLVELDRSNTRVARDQAMANLAQSVRQVRQLFEQVAEQEALVNRRATQLKQAERDFERDKRLLKIHGVSRKQFQHTELQYDGAKAQFAEAKHRLGALQAMTDNTSLRQHPKVQQAAAKLEDAYLNFRRTTIPAPVSGYVAQRQVQLGQKVAPGKPMLAIVPLDQLWAEANFKETELAQMRIGQPVSITADFYGDEVQYHGRVAGISAGSGSAFELLPPQNATGNWIKIVRRVPVRVALDADELKKHPLRLGLSLQASVDIHNTDGPVLASKTPAKPAYSTDIYRRSQAEVQALIDRVIEQNSGQAPALQAASP